VIGGRSGIRSLKVTIGRITRSVSRQVWGSPPTSYGVIVGVGVLNLLFVRVGEGATVSDGPGSVGVTVRCGMGVEVSVGPVAVRVGVGPVGEGVRVLPETTMLT
jgi:hypothetical protein